MDVDKNKSNGQEIDRQIGNLPNSFGCNFFFYLLWRPKGSVAAWSVVCGVNVMKEVALFSLFFHVMILNVGTGRV